MMLLLFACASSVDLKDSPDGQIDSAADTADSDSGGGDSDTGDPLEELGFDLDGSWYDLLPTDTSCQQYGGIYAITSSPSMELVAYVYFGGPPDPGDYTVVAWTGLESSLEPATVGFAFVGMSEWMPSGNSTGAGGSVEVFVSAPATAVVSWTDLVLADYQGNAVTSTSGMVACL